jgi:hypothetical protein
MRFLQLTAILLGVGFVVVVYTLDFLDRLDSIEKRVPWLWRLMRNRAAIFALLVLCIIFLARDFSDALAFHPAPIVEIAAPQAPDLHELPDLRRERESLRQQLSAVQSQQERQTSSQVIVQQPAPEFAEIQFTLVEQDVATAISGNETTLPALDGTVTVRFAWKNTGSVTARDGVVIMRICKTCSYKDEVSRPWTQVTGAPSTDRTIRYQSLLAKTYSEILSVKVVVPEEARRVALDLTPACDTCTKNGEIQRFWINVLRPTPIALQQP